MLTRDAKALARRWVEEEVSSLPGFEGAYLSGSVTWRDDDEEHPRASDIDIHVVIDGDARPDRPSKFLYHDALLGAGYVNFESLGTPEELLADFQRSGAFWRPTILADTTGRVTKLQQAVQKEFPTRPWVEKRVEHVRNHCLRYCSGQRVEPLLPYPDAVTAWAFASGLLSTLPLVAALRNPTVRLRYLAARDILNAYGQIELYETILEPLGCRGFTREQVERHMPGLEAAYDAAGPALKTPIFFSGDLSADARRTSIDGSYDLIARGDHREAVFWLVVTYSRCMKVFETDAPDLYNKHEAGYSALLGELGIESRDDLRERAAQVESLLPRVWEVAQEIIAANPEVVD